MRPARCSAFRRRVRYSPKSDNNRRPIVLVRSALTNPVQDGLNDSEVVLVDAASALVLRDKRAAGVASGGQWIAREPSGWPATAIPARSVAAVTRLAPVFDLERRSNSDRSVRETATRGDRHLPLHSVRTPRTTESGEAPACHKSKVPRVLQV